MSAIQTRVITECLHAAGLPEGVFNIVTGDGAVVGSALTSHRDVSKIRPRRTTWRRKERT